MTVEPGEIYGFLGPNGAGKTTLVRVLTTLLRPTAGSAIVAGADVVRDTEAVRYRIGVALQEASLDPGQTGRELLDLQASLFAIPKAVARTRVAELIELVDLGDAIDRRVKFTSGELVTYSPVAKDRIGPGMTLAELCEAAVTLSDNTAGNLLLAAIGGPAGLTAYVRGLGDT